MITLLSRTDRKVLVSNYLVNLYLFSTVSSSSSPASMKGHKLYPSIDWDRVGAGAFALVTPDAPDVVFYATESEYLGLLRVFKSKDSRLIVLAAPFETEVTVMPSKPSLKSPPPLIDILGRVKSFISPLIKEFVKWTVEDRDGTSLRVTSENLVPVILKYGKLLYFWAIGKDLKKLDLIALTEFAETVKRYHDNQGYLMMSKSLKSAIVYLGHHLSGRPKTNPWLLGHGMSICKDGIPKCFPNQWRRNIREKNLPYIRFIISLLSFYRGTIGSETAPVDLSSITDPFPLEDLPDFEGILSEGLPQYEVQERNFFHSIAKDFKPSKKGKSILFWDKWFTYDRTPLQGLMRKASIFPIWSSSANARPGDRKSVV